MRFRQSPMLSKFARTTSRAVHPAQVLRPVTARAILVATQRTFCASTTSTAGEVDRHEFKAETKKLLDIVAKSLYTDKEVFVRELISNASDALEKLRYLQSTNQLEIDDAALSLRLITDAENRIFTIQDSGIGMTKEEMIANLGTIAKSGSKEFLQKEGDANQIIGQFGVGFYSTFVVAESVQVFSRSARGGPGHLWESTGDGEFTIREVADLPHGTKIVLKLREECSDFAKEDVIKKTASKFSSFVNFPINIGEGEAGSELSKQEPLWLQTSASDEEHTKFFQYLGNTSYGEPMYSLLFHTDAPLSIKSAFYIPEEAPNRWFQQDTDIQVSLHSRKVLVKKNAVGIIPKWLHWVKGVVDCEDMPLNISRESMQDSAMMQKLSTAVVSRILSFLNDQSRKDPEKYAKFFKKYSFYLKSGLLEDQQQNAGRNKNNIVKLLRFQTSAKDSDELMSLADYLDGIPETQKNIYYFTSSNRATAMASPYMEQFLKNDRNVILLTEDIDEFVLNHLDSFKDKKFVSIDSEKDLEFENDAAIGSGLSEEEQSTLSEWVKTTLGSPVGEVKFSTRLVSSPAVLTSQMSPHMRKMMKSMMGGSDMGGMPSNLELNPNHAIVKHLYQIRESNPEVAKLAAEQLLDNASIAAGMLEEPRSILERLNRLVEVTVAQAAGHDFSKDVKVETDESVQKAKVDAQPDVVNAEGKFTEMRS